MTKAALPRLIATHNPQQLLAPLTDNTTRFANRYFFLLGAHIHACA
jgi:hypothetical protein